MDTSVVPTPSETGTMSAFDRIINVFFSPSKTFTDLNRNNSWWPAWLLISVFAFGFMLTVNKQVGFDQVTRNEIAASARATEQLDKLTPEARDSQITIRANFTKWMSYGVPLTVLIIASIIAGVFLASFNLGLGTEMKFGTVLAVLFYAWVPGILKSLLASISLFAGADPEGFNINNPAATNLGFFVSRIDHPVLHTLLSTIDIFAIWSIILLGIGFSCVSKVKRSTATGMVAGWYAFFWSGVAGIVAIFS